MTSSIICRIATCSTRIVLKCGNCLRFKLAACVLLMIATATRIRRRFSARQLEHDPVGASASTNDQLLPLISDLHVRRTHEHGRAARWTVLDICSHTVYRDQAKRKRTGNVLARANLTGTYVAITKCAPNTKWSSSLDNDAGDGGDASFRAAN